AWWSNSSSSSKLRCCQWSFQWPLSSCQCAAPVEADPLTIKLENSAQTRRARFCRVRTRTPRRGSAARPIPLRAEERHRVDHQPSARIVDDSEAIDEAAPVPDRHGYEPLLDDRGNRLQLFLPARRQLSSSRVLLRQARWQAANLRRVI